MRCFVGIDDTDSSRGLCTTYLAYRIAADLLPDVKVLPYPRLVRLNPNVPFKTRGNAAVCLQVETSDLDHAFEVISEKVRSLSDVSGGANSGMVMLEDPALSSLFDTLYLDALSGIVSPARVRRLLLSHRVRTFELGNGMGLVGAASSLAFDERFDHTYELISYRREECWGSARAVDPSSVRAMDKETFPNTFNNYDYQKKKVLITPHGPDPVFAGVRGNSPDSVIHAFGMLDYAEKLDGYMVFVTNQHTDAHLQKKLEWKAYSSGWIDGTVADARVGEGGHTYLALECEGVLRWAAAYEPTGDLRRTVHLLKRGDRIRAFGGVRRQTSLHPTILNLEKVEVTDMARMPGRILARGTYISSPRANRHLTKPFARYGSAQASGVVLTEDWMRSEVRIEQALVQSL